jgi:hypothetical protein
MDAAWTRALLAAATTLAAASTQPKSHAESCSLHQDQLQCSSQDPHVYPKHVLAPLVVPCAVQVFASMPTLLLASVHRARRLRAAAASLAALWSTVVACALAYAYFSRSFAYALSLHASALFLLRIHPGANLLGQTSLRAAKVVALAVLCAGALYAGPPLPVLGSPGLSGCCGSACHLLAWAAMETLGALMLSCVVSLGELNSCLL